MLLQLWLQQPVDLQRWPVAQAGLQASHCFDALQNAVIAQAAHWPPQPSSPQ